MFCIISEEEMHVIKEIEVEEINRKDPLLPLTPTVSKQVAEMIIKVVKNSPTKMTKDVRPGTTVQADDNCFSSTGPPPDTRAPSVRSKTSVKSKTALDKFFNAPETRNSMQETTTEQKTTVGVLHQLYTLLCPPVLFK